VVGAPTGPTGRGRRPAKYRSTTRDAGAAPLQNAASVASLMLTTEALIAEKPKDEKRGAGGHAGHGHGGGMGGGDF
jgi:hypothetical protein